MGKKQEVPSITLADCLRELTLINGEIFKLKLGVSNIISTVEKGGSAEDVKSVIAVFDLKQVIDNLSDKF